MFGHFGQVYVRRKTFSTHLITDTSNGVLSNVSGYIFRFCNLKWFQIDYTFFSHFRDFFQILLKILSSCVQIFLGAFHDSATCNGFSLAFFLMADTSFSPLFLQGFFIWFRCVFLKLVNKSGYRINWYDVTSLLWKVYYECIKIWHPAFVQLL